MPKRFIRPALIGATVLAALLTASAGVGSARMSPNLSTAHPQPLKLLQGTKPDAISNSAVSTSDTAKSTNWAGYVATGNKTGAQFRYVQATFTVPSLNCAAAPGTTSAPATVSAWVGLDGVGYNFGSSSTVEQDGIVGQCVNGVAEYGAWWENYPNLPTYPNITVSAGDAIEADVYYDSARTVAQGQYNFTLTDVTTGQSFGTWQKCGASSCKNSSAEVITEAPSDSTTGAVLPVADYGLANFENVAITDRAGQRAGVTSSNWISTEVLQVNSAGTVLQQPGSLYGGAAFTDTWKRAS
jgi:Peptidase A4 family